ncbi:MAG: hypothetical protein MUE44_34700 [Oscillatoriaceae cyanobacterium Prado104]|jgi:hypothetical protein|nr:hypothetical protein [Oscillatoriaceae cyanobacterium Prado104]
MNNTICADRLLIGNTIISVSAIVRADYNSDNRKLTIKLIDGSNVNLQDNFAEATWDYLRAFVYGCVSPLPTWEKNCIRSSQVRVNE